MKIVVKCGEVFMKKKKTISQIFSIFTNLVIVFAVLIIFINLFLIFSGNRDKKVLPDIFGYKFLVELSDSMKPSIQVGDLVIIKEKESYQKGDIISYRDVKDIIVTHRINKVVMSDDNEYFQTKGDHNKTCDTSLVSEKQIEGASVMKISGLGNVCLFLSSPIGMGVLILIIIVLFLIDFLIQKVREEEE